MRFAVATTPADINDSLNADETAIQELSHDVDHLRAADAYLESALDRRGPQGQPGLPGMPGSPAPEAESDGSTRGERGIAVLARLRRKRLARLAARRVQSHAQQLQSQQVALASSLRHQLTAVVATGQRAAASEWTAHTGGGPRSSAHGHTRPAGHRIRYVYEPA